jgi:hypothetical protein
MTEQKKSGYECPAISVCQIYTEAVLCASTGIDDLEVKDTQDWGWEE